MNASINSQEFVIKTHHLSQVTPYIQSAIPGSGCFFSVFVVSLLTCGTGCTFVAACVSGRRVDTLETQTRKHVITFEFHSNLPDSNTNVIVISSTTGSINFVRFDDDKEIKTKNLKWFLYSH